ncbi:hypothetical protein [Fictibacillus barbaricus]|uniref:Uncharacterized protein n=1 Tax=Fictibacillus barbaricus TaxID=182136 RepID=A0ABS2ZDU8_9BACL|nr:hypothetical protein [Fictibacillus barbaricus]MBN3544796.1 hypothetical protein [Fictibacillus barbaricus]
MALQRKKKRKQNGEQYTWFDLILDILFVVPELLIWLVRILGRGIFRLFDGI